jgi:hypothetical protein
MEMAADIGKKPDFPFSLVKIVILLVILVVIFASTGNPNLGYRVTGR